MLSLHLKQDALAWELGDDWNQQKVSLLEQKEVIDDAILRHVSQILKIPVEAIKNFDEENAVNVIANTFTDSFNNSTNAFAYNNNCTFNPIDKLIQFHEEKIALYEEKIALYERMLKEKDEMMAMMKGLLGGK